MRKNYFLDQVFIFIKKVIELIRQSADYGGLLNTDSFLEYIYATLASWGMHRMGPKGAKMKRSN